VLVRTCDTDEVKIFGSSLDHESLRLGLYRAKHNAPMDKIFLVQSLAGYMQRDSSDTVKDHLHGLFAVCPS
jgi:hypothetical protein